MSASDASLLIEPFARQWPLCARALRAQENNWNARLNEEDRQSFHASLGDAAQLGQWIAHPVNTQLPACWPVSQALLELCGETLSLLDFADRSFSVTSAQSALSLFAVRLAPLCALARATSSRAPLGPPLPSHLGFELLAQTARIAELSEAADEPLSARAGLSVAEQELQADRHAAEGAAAVAADGLHLRADGWRLKAERRLAYNLSFQHRANTFRWFGTLLGVLLVLTAIGVGDARSSLPTVTWHLPWVAFLGARLGGGSFLIVLGCCGVTVALRRLGACFDRLHWVLKSRAARNHRSLARACWFLLSPQSSAETLLLASFLCFLALCLLLGA